MDNRVYILDPGHGMSNKRAGVYDPGVVYTAGGLRYEEAAIAMMWVNCLRDILKKRGKDVVRTRIDHRDPAPVWRRDDIARDYKGFRMISFHVNSTPGATGTETFYRGKANKAFAEKLNAIACETLGTKNRGAKEEGQSQHPQLAIMEFKNCWLLELGFIENDFDRAQMLNPTLMKKCCTKIADLIES